MFLVRCLRRCMLPAMWLLSALVSVPVHAVPPEPAGESPRPGLPERYQGHYISESVWQMLTSDKVPWFNYGAYEGLTFGERDVRWAIPEISQPSICSSSGALELLSQQPDELVMAVEEERQCDGLMEGPPTVTVHHRELRFWIEGATANTYGLTENAFYGRYRRLHDALPGLTPPAVWSESVAGGLRAWTAATFSRGWVEQSGPRPSTIWRMIYNLETEGFELVRGAESHPAKTNLDETEDENTNIWMTVDDPRAVWLVEVQDYPGGRTTLTLEHRDHRGGFSEVEDEGRVELVPLSSAPFVVLADVLNLRAAPDRKAASIGTLTHGSPVQVWARSGRAIEVGPVVGEWVLVRHKSTIGWAFSPYVGERLDPSASEGPDVHVLPVLSPGAPIAASVQGSDGHCSVNGVSQHRLRDPGLTGAHVMLARLNDDGVLDPSCIFTTEDGAFVCPVLSSEGSTEWTATNCVPWNERALPAISGKDTTGDGVRDLVLRGESTQSFPLVLDTNQYALPAGSP